MAAGVWDLIFIDSISATLRHYCNIFPMSLISFLEYCAAFSLLYLCGVGSSFLLVSYRGYRLPLPALKKKSSPHQSGSRKTAPHFLSTFLLYTATLWRFCLVVFLPVPGKNQTQKHCIFLKTRPNDPIGKDFFLFLARFHFSLLSFTSYLIGTKTCWVWRILKLMDWDWLSQDLVTMCSRPVIPITPRGYI